MKTLIGQVYMKNKALRVICFIVFFLVYLILMPGCKKSGVADDHGNGNTDDTPSLSCTATKADAENLQLFPTDNAWNLDISSAQVDPYNSQIIAGFASNVIKADFGSGLWEGAPIGIPYVVVCGNQTKYPVVFRSNSYDGNYGDESDAGPYPVPLTAPIEGNGGGDSHVIALDKENKILYELYNASVNNGRWEASSGAIFDLKTNALRPDGWTSADAAGLPIFAGLVRYEEILKGVIDHPVRFTLPSSKVKPAYIHPARHKVNSTGGQFSSLPFGARIRLKASFDISSFSATNKIILAAMKKYGLILADIGSNLYITGAPDERWNNDDLRQLGQVHGSDFEVVKFNN
ncbi:MAG: hypothetical protein JNK14_03360 [Chitinophagaceae bacterium]|nr:hypothetical protein [Chitinophagaceae bacterium]